jgi:cyanophycinase
MTSLLRAFVLVLLPLVLGMTTVDNAQAEEQAQSFFLIGGNADSTLYDFAKLAGGSKAHVAVITYAETKPEEAADAIENALSAANVRHTTIIAADTKNPTLPKDVDAVYLIGGNESRLMRRVKEPLVEELKNFHGLIGGNSAGAMAAATLMISGGLEKGTIKAQELHVADGLALLPGVAIDSHVGQRNRDARCAASLGAIPGVKMAIGLDEDTAIYVQGHHATVYGVGHVRVFRPGPSFVTTLDSTPKGGTASVHNVLVSYLKAGESFDLPAE